MKIPSPLENLLGTKSQGTQESRAVDSRTSAQAASAHTLRQPSILEQRSALAGADRSPSSGAHDGLNSESAPESKPSFDQVLSNIALVSAAQSAVVNEAEGHPNVTDDPLGSAKLFPGLQTQPALPPDPTFSASPDVSVTELCDDCIVSDANTPELPPANAASRILALETKQAHPHSNTPAEQRLPVQTIDSVAHQAPRVAIHGSPVTPPLQQVTAANIVQESGHATNVTSIESPEYTATNATTAISSGDPSYPGQQKPTGLAQPAKESIAAVVNSPDSPGAVNQPLQQTLPNHPNPESEDTAERNKLEATQSISVTSNPVSELSPAAFPSSLDGTAVTDPGRSNQGYTASNNVYSLGGSLANQQTDGTLNATEQSSHSLPSPANRTEPNAEAIVGRRGLLGRSLRDNGSPSDSSRAQLPESQNTSGQSRSLQSRIAQNTDQPLLSEPYSNHQPFEDQSSDSRDLGDQQRPDVSDRRASENEQALRDLGTDSLHSSDPLTAETKVVESSTAILPLSRSISGEHTVIPSEISPQEAIVSGFQSLPIPHKPDASGFPAFRIETLDFGGTTTPDSALAGPLAEKVASSVVQLVGATTDGQTRSVSIELFPEELGHLKIQVQQTAESIVTQIVASESVSSDLLLLQRENLVQALSDLGFDDASVEISHRQHHASDQDNEPNRQRNTHGLDGSLHEAAPADANAPSQRSTSTGLNIVA